MESSQREYMLESRAAEPAMASPSPPPIAMARKPAATVENKRKSEELKPLNTLEWDGKNASYTIIISYELCQLLQGIKSWFLKVAKM